MKKLLALTAAIVAATCAIPSTASADTLRMGPFRDYVADKAYNDFTSTADADAWYIDRCRRLNPHRLRCDANVRGKQAFCENGTCFTQVFLCYRTITRTLSPHWQRFRITNQSTGRRCIGDEPVPVPA